MRPEVLADNCSPKKLKTVDVSNLPFILPEKDLFIGSKAGNMLQLMKPDQKKKILSQVKQAYINCAKSLQSKMPINNPLLKSVSAIHPHLKGHTLSMKYLLKLPSLVTNILKPTEEDKYDMEVRRYINKNTLPEYADHDRLDVWWGKDELCDQYPHLFKMVTSLLSCFHGPQVEASFSVMNNVIDSKTCRLNISTYNAIQHVKYGLTASGKSAVQFYAKDDFVHDKIDSTLARNMVTSSKAYKSEVKKRKEESEEKKELLEIKSKALTKKRSKELLQSASKKARLFFNK